MTEKYKLCLVVRKFEGRSKIKKMERKRRKKNKGKYKIDLKSNLELWCMLYATLQLFPFASGYW